MPINALSLQAAAHPIKLVTIFKSSRAEVVRTFPVILKRGHNKLEINGLPCNIQAVRTSGLGTVARLDDFSCTVGRDQAGTSEEQIPSDVIRDLIRKKEWLETAKNVQAQELALLNRYSQTLTGEHVSPSDLTNFLQTFAEKSSHIVQASAELDEKIIQIAREIDNETLNARKQAASSKIDAVITAAEDASVVLNVSYIVEGCGWEAKYELRANTDNGKPSPEILLHYLATVKQHTGEDWTNARLTLSTNETDTLPKTLPRLGRLKIRGTHSHSLSHSNGAVYDTGTRMRRTAYEAESRSKPTHVKVSVPRPPPPPPRAGAAPLRSLLLQEIRSRALPAGHDVGELETGADGFEEVHYEDGVLEDNAQTTVIVKETPLSMTFSVSDAANVPSDDLEHEVMLAIIPFEANIAHVTLPSIDPRVFLQCEIKNNSDYKLLRGPIGVVLDDSYMSSTTLASDVNPGDTFACLFGTDSALKVVYKRTSKTAHVDGGSFGEDQSVTSYTQQVDIRNKHSFDIDKLVVYDSLPVSDDSRVKVVLRKPEGLAEAENSSPLDVGTNGLRVGWCGPPHAGGRDEGIFSWSLRVCGGETVTMVAEYGVRAPKGMNWAISRIDASF